LFSALAIAYLINRYTTKIYTVTASILVREGDENAAAEFLYKSNPLINPYRNFYNELYIMKSYPLMEQVIDELNFSVVWYREGNVKTSEFYDRNFPILIKPVGRDLPYGERISFTLKDSSSFEVELLTPELSAQRAFRGKLSIDTISVNGFRLAVAGDPARLDDLIHRRFVVSFVDPQQLAKSYASRLSAQWAEQGASVINLAISGPVPEKEVEFVSRFISVYQRYDVDKKNQAATKSIEFLDRQLANIGDSLSYFDNKIEDFKQSQLYTNFDNESARILERLEKLESQKTEFTLQENYFKYLEEYLGRGKDFDQIVPPSAVGITDQVLTDLVSQLTQLQFSLRMLGDLQTVENPIVVERQRKIQQVKKDLMEGVNSIRATQKININFVSQQIKAAEKSLAQLPQSERELINIKRNYSIRENLYLFLMQKRAEAGISRASTTSDVLVVNPPNRSGGPITPKPTQNYAIAFGGGLLFPFIFFFLAEFLNDKIQSKEDIEQFTHIPLIGGIGHSPTDQSNLVVFEKPKSSIGESLRALRSNLNYFTQGKDKKIILITSSIGGEGKTFTTINLATVLAYAGKRVLIIGADMRKPRIYSDFQLTNDIGLSSYLSSSAKLDEVIQKTSMENLFLMSGGPVPPNPSELLLLPKVGAMVEE
ncbi:MAG: AAA family ATPase, partial [Cyclobacteriaceae bacterium]|nr:AAA family ATPase [Cyclobacteriaceae bacterium]